MREHEIATSAWKSRPTPNPNLADIRALMITTKINPTLSLDCLHSQDPENEKKIKGSSKRFGCIYLTMTEIAGVMGLIYARECLLMGLKRKFARISKLLNEGILLENLGW